MSDMKDLSQLNAALAAASMPTRVTALMRLLSTKQSMLTMLNSLSQEYSNMYSKLQLLKYDQNNDPIDVTTANALTAIDTTIALYKQSWATAKSTVQDLEELLDRLNPEEVNNYTAIDITDECSSLTPIVWYAESDSASLNRKAVQALINGLKAKVQSQANFDGLGDLPFLHFSIPVMVIGPTELYNPRDFRIQRFCTCADISVVWCQRDGVTNKGYNFIIDVSDRHFTGRYTTSQNVGTQPSSITYQTLMDWLDSIDIDTDFSIDPNSDRAYLIDISLLSDAVINRGTSATTNSIFSGSTIGSTQMTCVTVGDRVALVDQQMIESVDIRALDAALSQL